MRQNIYFRLFFRLLAFPFFLGLLIVAMMRNLVHCAWLLIRYGGESIPYTETVNIHTIADLIKKVESLKNKEP